MNDKFLWVEKYAPQTIEDCVLPSKLKEEFSSMKTIPNMLFAGDAGVGKTTVARVLCETLNTDMMFINASLKNGIDEVRTQIQNFASTTALFGDYKVILLDEADNITPDAQKALRALVEAHQNNCRFILTCNYPYNIIEPLRGRLQEFYFTYPKDGKTLRNTFIKRILEILQQEKVSLSKEDVPALVSLVDLGYPNWRQCLHQLQRITKSGSVDHHLIDQIKDSHISTLIEIMKVKNFTKMRDWIAEAICKDISPQKMLLELYNAIDAHMKPASRPGAVVTMAQYQSYAPHVSNHELNLVACCVELMMGVEWQ